jgi:O-antigen ligase
VASIKTIEINKIRDYLILAPYIFTCSAMMFLPSSDKKSVVFFVVGLIFSLTHPAIKNTIHHNIRQPIIWLIASIALYTVFSDYHNGISAKEIRAILSCLLFFIFFPVHLLTRNFWIAFTFTGSLVSLVTSYYYAVHLDIGRSSGPINPIIFATIGSTFSVLSISLFRSANKNNIQTYFSLTSFLLSAASVLLTQSRGLWVALFFIIIFFSIEYLFRQKVNKKHIIKMLLITTVISASSYLLLNDKIDQRIETTKNELVQIQSGNFNTSIGLRLQMWSAVPKLAYQNLLFGSGDNHTKIFQKSYKEGLISESLYSFKPIHYHNQILDKLVKGGVIGALLVIPLLVVPLLNKPHHSSFEYGCIVSVTTLYFIAGLTDVPFNYGQTLTLYLLVLTPICMQSRDT